MGFFFKHITVCREWGLLQPVSQKTKLLNVLFLGMSEMVFTEASQIQTSIILVAASGEKLRIGSLSSLLHILFDLLTYAFVFVWTNNQWIMKKFSFFYGLEDNG